MTGKVEVPKVLLVGLAGVAAAALLGTVFLLGRESGRGARAEPGAPETVPRTPEAGPKPPEADPAPPFAPPVATEIPPAPSPGPEKPMRPFPPVAPAAPSDEALRPAVAAYFQALEAAQPSTGGDPEALAQRIAGSLGNGDSSGFDTLVQQAQGARSRLAALVPPPPCMEHHRESLASLDAGLDLMRSIRKALSGSDGGSGVMELSERAAALKARAEALQARERALKVRYGVK